jgi:hypothetical protein
MRATIEISLLEIFTKEQISEDDIIVRFFENITNMPEKKDYYVRDFEEFYFKIRPKYAPPVIKIILEVSTRFKIFMLGRFKAECMRIAIFNE